MATAAHRGLREKREDSMSEADAQALSDVAALSVAAVDKAVEQTAAEGQGEEIRMRGYTITKFSRHEDGYFHARVTPSGGRTVYIHNRYGSWLCPGKYKGRELLKEPESLGLTFEMKAELSRRAKAQTRRERNEANGGDGDDGDLDAQPQDSDDREDDG